MILYNTIVGLAAGVGLLLVVKLLKEFGNSEKVQPEGFELAAVRLCWGVAGMLLVFFSTMNYFTHIALLMNTSDSL